VKLAPFATTEVTLCAVPFHDAVRPVRNSERAPPCTTLVFEASDPAPKTDQPVVPPSMSAFVSRFPLAATAPGTDTATSEASVRNTARPNELVLMILFLFISRSNVVDPPAASGAVRFGAGRLMGW
jgi:hypothetical protein